MNNGVDISNLRNLMIYLRNLKLNIPHEQSHLRMINSSQYPDVCNAPTFFIYCTLHQNSIDNLSEIGLNKHEEKNYPGIHIKLSTQSTVS